VPQARQLRLELRLELRHAGQRRRHGHAAAREFAFELGDARV
jgi:hypothetical protein